MRPTLVSVVAAAALITALSSGCASLATTARTSSQPGQTESARQAKTDPGKLSEREKWKLARDTYAQAQREQSRKNSEAAAYYYEVVLELLGTLDMASIEVPTQRVLTFQRKVLKSYDQFLASVEKLPSTAGPEAVFEASIPEAGTSETTDATADDRDQTPAPIIPNAPPLPSVPLAMNSQVAGQVNFFMNKGRNVMLRWMERAAYMFPRMRPILREEGIPEEVMYLAMIESGLNPRAYSYAHAAGVWQFIPSTGRIYGLQINSVYDERLHVESSTRAACRYLRKLYTQFDDWYLAFAAYNCGEMRIERESRKHGRDYWQMKKLPRQTRGYVPIYLAARTICEDPTRYGFPQKPPEVPFECERTSVDGAYRLDHIAQAAGLDPDQIKDLNPEYTRGVTCAGRSNMIRLPRKPDMTFAERLLTMPQTVVQPTSTHKVRRGETLGQIAAKYGTTVKAIQSLPENRGVKSNRLRVGQRITIPVASVAAPETLAKKEATASATPAAASTKPITDEIIYTVHAGESLSKISRQLGVAVDEICRQNGIKDPDVVQPGKKLRIRVAGGTDTVAKSASQGLPSEANPTAIGQRHTVQRGDTVWSIANKYGQDYEKILRWNRLSSRSKIYPGQEIIVNQQ